MKHLPYGGFCRREKLGAWRKRLRMLMAVLSAGLAFPSSHFAGGVVTDCTQAALQAAMEGGGVVSFQTGTNCSITLTQAIWVAGNTVTVIDAGGHDVSLSGGGATRLFTVAGNLTLIGLRLTNGRNDNGGAAFVTETGILVATNCVFQGNTAAGTNGVAGADGRDVSNGSGGDGGDGTAGTPARGGAIHNLGTVTLVNCQLTQNSATGGNGGNGGSGGDSSGTLGTGGNGGRGGAGAMGVGGAVFNTNSLTVINCTFGGNVASGGNAGTGGAGGAASFPGRPGSGSSGAASYGGAIYNLRNVSMWSSAFASNAVRGGSSSAGGVLSVLDGEPGYNGPEAGGGAFFSSSWSVITNCTFYTNTAHGGAGGNGGIGMRTISLGGIGGNGGNGVGGGILSRATTQVIHSTLVNCGAFGGTNGLGGAAAFPGDPGKHGSALGGNIYSSSASTSLRGNLIGRASSGNPGSGSITDQGYNMLPDASLALGGQSFPNTTNINAGPFGDNGGPTPTVSLLTNSAAMDRIPPAEAPATDQRGVPRPLNSLSDVGAYESELRSAPLVLRQPVNTSTSPGVPVTFSVSAVGASPLRYQWRFLQAPIARATNSAYTVAAPGTSNQGPYDVVITNALGSVTSDAVYFALLPTISSQPTDQVVPVGGDVSFRVVAAGEGQLTYQWRFNGTNLLAGATSSLLALADVQVSDIGTYAVEVRNGAGAVTSSAASLNLLPTILAQSGNVTNLPGTPAVFTVQAEGSPPLRYQWRHNGVTILGANSDVLNIPDARTTNAGVYSVVVANDYGSTNSLPASLVVQLTILQQPVSQTGANGEPATFSVAAEGTPPLSYQWRRNGLNVFGATASAYTVTNGAATAGTYSVFIRDARLTTNSSSALLNLIPFIQAEPTNQVVRAGSPAVFCVVAAASPAPVYQWRRNGVDIPGATDACYSIASVQAQDLGGYRVLVANAVGSKLSAEATLSFGIPPSVTVPPADRIAVAGEDVQFSIAATGTAPLSYQWRFHETNLPGQTASTLLITNAQLTSIGTYGVVVTNEFGAAARAAELQLRPSIERQPADTTVVLGGTATFTVAATASPEDLAYQWWNGTNAVGSGPVCTIANVQSNQVGAYYVEITNRFGSVVSSNAMLRIGERPEIVAQSPGGELILSAGQSALFFVHATGTAPLSYQWRRDITNVIPGATATNYVIAGAGMGDIGSYDVVVANVVGTNSTTPVRLELRPSILTQPASVAVAPNSSATFVVNAVGSTNQFGYQWRRNGLDLPGASGSSLTVTNARSADIGDYVVVVTNAFGSSNSAPARLDLLPGIMAGPASTWCIIGSNAVFSVAAAGSEPLGYQWLFNGAPIAGAHSPVYAMSGVDRSRQGAYAVVVTNAFGTARSEDAILSVVDPLVIAGRVLDAASNGISGVRIVASSTALTNAVWTDTNGYYFIPGLQSNTYALAASMPCYGFSPAVTNVSFGQGGSAAADFTGVADDYSITGSIAAGNDPLYNVFALLLDDETVVASVPVTNGSFTFTHLCAGNYTVIPSGADYFFFPAVQSVSVPQETNVIHFQAVGSFTVSGRVTRQDGSAWPGLNVSVTNAADGSLAGVVSTGPDGSYSLAGLGSGSYRIAPQLVSCTNFVPEFRQVIVGPSSSAQDFRAQRDGAVIKGQITEGTVGVSNLIVAVGSQRTTTDTNGNYAFTGLCAGSYTVAPQDNCYRFTPASRVLTVTGANTAVADFAAARNAYAISGEVTFGGQLLAGATVSVGTATNITDSNGKFTLSDLCPGEYVVTPYKDCLVFYPSQRSVVIVGQSVDQVNFASYTNDIYSISGTVTLNATGFAGVTITATNLAGVLTAETGANGNYVFAQLCPGPYTLVPSREGYRFQPASIPIPNLRSDLTNQSFFAFPVYGISGQITSNGVGLDGIRVQTGTNSVITANGGYYTFTNLPAATHTITPVDPCTVFVPPSRTVTLQTNVANVDFAAIANNIFAVRGRVTEGPYPLAGVVLLRMGTEVETKTSDTNGSYAFYDLCPGTNSVVPEYLDPQGRALYDFKPARYDFVIATDQNTVDFSAHPSLRISRFGTNQVQIFGGGTPGTNYTLEGTINLGSTNQSDWLEITNARSPIEVLEPIATNSAKYYRLRR